MKVVTWNNDDGRMTIAVPFANGTSAAESAKTFTPEEAKKAITWLRKHCGANYENNNLPWTLTDAKTGETRPLFYHRNLASF